jgi:hypothetical protein
MQLSTVPWRDMGEWRYKSIHDLSTRYRWIVNFTSRDWAPSTHSIRCWLGPSASLDAMEKRKISYPNWGWNLDHPACTPTDWAVLASLYLCSLDTFSDVFPQEKSVWLRSGECGGQMIRLLWLICMFRKWFFNELCSWCEKWGEMPSWYILQRKG